MTEYNLGITAVFDKKVQINNFNGLNKLLDINKIGGFKVFIPLIKIILDEKYENKEQYINDIFNIIELYKKEKEELFKEEKIYDILCLLLYKYNISNDNLLNKRVIKLGYDQNYIIFNKYELKLLLNKEKDLLNYDIKIFEINYLIIEEIIEIMIKNEENKYKKIDYLLDFIYFYSELEFEFKFLKEKDNEIEKLFFKIYYLLDKSYYIKSSKKLIL